MSTREAERRPERESGAPAARQRQRRAAWCGLLAGLMMLIAGATGIVRWMAGDGGLLAREMLAAAPPEKSGLPEAEYAGVGRMIAGYLTGRVAEFQYIYADEKGETRAAFHEREAMHMADCRGLIALDGKVCLAALGAAGLLTAFGLAGGRSAAPRTGGTGSEGRNDAAAVNAQDRRSAFGRGMIRSLWIAAGIAIVIGGWAAVDFDGFFRAFHRIAFTNDLWLMNPRTDLLIRLMPTGFFTALGARGLGFFLLLPMGMILLVRVAFRSPPGSPSGRTE